VAPWGLERGINSLRQGTELPFPAWFYPEVKIPLKLTCTGCPEINMFLFVRLPRGARPERHEILRYAQNDTKRRARNDKGMFFCSFQTVSIVDCYLKGAE